MFTTVRTLTLTGIDPANAVAFAGDSKGNIYVVDSAIQLVRKFDSDGRSLGVIGKTGREAGAFITPWSLSCDGQDNLYVLDVATGRINIFDSRSNFRSSLLVSTFGFIGIGIHIAQSGDLFIGGVQRPNRAGSPLLYKLNEKGDLLFSAFPRNLQVDNLHLGLVGTVVFDIAPDGLVYAAQPVEPKISIFSTHGEQLSTFGVQPSGYRAPFKFPERLPSDHKKVQKLLDQWTQVADLRILSSQQLVLLTLNEHSPVGFILQVYSDKGKLLVSDIGTDLLPAFNSANHLFLYNPTEKILKLTEVVPDLARLSAL